MKVISKIFIIPALSLVSLASFAQTVTATGSTLDEAHAKIAAQAKEAGAEYSITEAYSGNRVHMTAELTR
ncbi:DUF1471 domain-containing protein [Leclercia adecarboxylata]|uniref:DUF1471 domain-containing protein n=1 Tax=Leclercia adecarboxylata TaxID=83655 RepID=UPI00057A42DA|nr:DUF1471 domain-containing protein [Leclercia adecarboxylata]